MLVQNLLLNLKKEVIMPQGFKNKKRSGHDKPSSYSYDEDQMPSFSQDHDGAFQNETLYEAATRLKEWNTFEFDGLKFEDKLDQIKNEVRIRIKITKQEIFRIGELLHLAKDICSQNGIGYKEWISENFDFSYETAHNFVSVYLQCLCYRDIAMNVPSSILYKISQRGFSQELREFLFEEGHLEKITGDKFKGIVDKYKEGGMEAVKADLQEIREGNLVKQQVRYTFDMCENALRTLDALRIKIESRGGVKERIIEYSTLLTMQHPLAAEVNRALWETLIRVSTELEGVINDSKDQVNEFLRRK
jgi:hypothetical protein